MPNPKEHEEPSPEEVDHGAELAKTFKELELDPEEDRPPEPQPQ